MICLQRICAGAGVLWIVGRIIYAKSYAKGKVVELYNLEVEMNFMFLRLVKGFLIMLAVCT